MMALLNVPSLGMFMLRNSRVCTYSTWIQAMRSGQRYRTLLKIIATDGNSQLS